MLFCVSTISTLLCLCALIFFFPPSFSLSSPPRVIPHLPVSSAGKYSEYKPSWPPEPIGQNKTWKTNRNSSQLPRPPPGLTNQKQASPSPWSTAGPRLGRNWGGGGGGGGGVNQESRYGPGNVDFLTVLEVTKLKCFSWDSFVIEIFLSLCRHGME